MNNKPTELIERRMREIAQEEITKFMAKQRIQKLSYWLHEIEEIEKRIDR
jgi:hypothetical protein